MAALVAATMMFSSATAFAQSDEEKAAARALATQGADALKGGRFAEALDYVTRAESIMHAPTHLLLIARAQAGAGKLVAAQETYLKLQHEELAATAPAAFRNAQAAAKEELAAIEPKIASLRLVVTGAVEKKATVKLDEAIVPNALLGVFRPVDPGPHVIAVYPVGGSPAKTNIELREGEKKEVKVVVPDGAPPSGVPVSGVDDPDAARQAAQKPVVASSGGGFMTPLRGVGIGLGVVGLALVATGGVFTAKGFSAASTANTNAKSLCSGTNLTNCTLVKGATSAQFASEVTANDDLAAKDKNIGVGVLVGGVAALGAGVALIIIGKPAPKTTGASITPFFAGQTGGFRGQF